MTDNNIRSRRRELKLTQKHVASLVDISQQHLQRLETGLWPVKMALAQKIAMALSTSMETLFPLVSKKEFERIPRTVADTSGLLVRKSVNGGPEELVRKWAEAGIEIEELQWRVYWRVAGAGTEFARISSYDVMRIMAEIEAERPSRFIHFDSDTHRFAVAVRDDIAFWFERDEEDGDDVPLPRLSDRRVSVFLADYKSPLEFECDHDEVDLHGDPSKRNDLQKLFMELLFGKSPRVRVVSRHDDEEAVHSSIHLLPVASIMSVSVPLALVNPDLRRRLEPETSAD